jgi:amino acid transporter
VADTTTSVPGGSSAEAGGKGLKGDALGLGSSIVIAVASTAPGYSLAAVLAYIALEAGYQSPAIMVLAFVPMYFIAKAYQSFNEVDPDCGTTFKWVWRGFGPRAGWLGGWGVIVADVLVMASLAQIAGSYFFLLFGADDLASNKYWVTLVGVIFLVVVTWICYKGIELSARTQFFLLGIEMAVLAVFSVVALWRAISGNGALETSVTPELSWLVPTGMSWGELAAGLILAIFIYWGWDTAVAVNEETSDPSKTPGKAAVLSTLALLATYVIVATAALAFGGVEGVTAEEHLDDILGYLGELVLGTWGGKLLILAVLTSAVASAQTTILPTARTTLSMAAYRAMPRSFARMHPTNLTPTVSTVTMGVVSIAFYAGLTFVSENVLADSIAATGLSIAFYYGITGFAAAWYFRNRAQGLGQAMAKIVLPFLGGIILFAAMIKVAYDSFDEDYGYTTFFGIGGVFVIGALSLALGVVLMILWNLKAPQYFRSQPEDIEPRVLVDQVQEYRLVVDASGIPYNPEALLAESREEPAVPETAEGEAVFLQDLGDESLNPPPTEPVDPDESPRA